MLLQKGDRVKQKNTRAIRLGTIIDIWSEDFYIEDIYGKKLLFAVQGEFKVNLDNTMEGQFITFSSSEIEKI